ncbi:Uncharacterized protein C4H3.03c [Erwinia sp. Ejp617]|nr:Uncharacterized protein C4H3.03c [Erwinia sp. Ejp617]
MHLAFISAAFFLDRRLSGAEPLWQPSTNKYRQPNGGTLLLIAKIVL